MNARLACVSALASLLVALSTASAERTLSDIPARLPLSDSILVNPRANWRLSSLRPEIRQRVHLSASKVPPFPHEDPAMMDPLKWPNAMLIAGEILKLKIEYMDYDYSREVRSMKDVPPGSSYTLSYAKDRGPVYTWLASGALVERSWRGERKLHPETYLNIYYPSGELMRFEYRSNGYNQRADPKRPAHCQQEVFARNGTLIGCGYVGQCGTDKAAFIGYWLGDEVTYREFQELELQFQRSAYRHLSEAKRPKAAPRRTPGQRH